LQRILSRDEIENLDHTLIPRVRLPDVSSVFADRATRLRALAADSPLQAYLLMMATVCDAQHQVVRDANLVMSEPDPERVSLAQAHGLPPLPAVGWQRDPVWRQMLHGILEQSVAAGVPTAAVEVCRRIIDQLQRDPDAVEQQADAVLARLDHVDTAWAPFVMAGLQAYWTRLAGQFSLDQLPVVTPFGVCPMCGMLPVSSVVRIGAQIDGCRYLGCPLCSTEWHLVRVTCSNCQDTEKIAFHSIEGGPEGIKAEACGKCHVYRKIFYQEKDPFFDAVADDLATLTLDIMMGEQGFSRASHNPMFWHHGGG